MVDGVEGREKINIQGIDIMLHELSVAEHVYHQLRLPGCTFVLAETFLAVTQNVTELQNVIWALVACIVGLPRRSKKIWLKQM